MVDAVPNESVPARLRTWALAVCRYVGSAPLTYGWLTVLLFTMIIQHELTRRQLHTLLVHESTNLRHLATDPLRVLASSLLWIDGRYWTPYLVLFTLFLAPAERWLGQIRWLTVGLTAHVGATYISEGVLYLAIQYHAAPERLVHARDIGVSYFLVGVMAVLSYHIAPPWRWGYVAVLVIIFGVLLIVKPDFTAIGHFSAIFIGICFEPMARRRDGPPLNPARAWARLRKAGRRVASA
ncbi:MAG TPA: rhomboid-like protein [Mycobacterium sp.]|nr:rhomboid-like protein [Mycobacterium sp.]